MKNVSNFFKNIFKAMLLSSLVYFSEANAAGFVDVPTKWKLESYGEKLVVLWFTPSTCANGSIGLPTSASITEHNRLFATIMAAKLAKAKIFIYYDDSIAGSCTIISYGLAEEN